MWKVISHWTIWVWGILQAWSLFRHLKAHKTLQQECFLSFLQLRRPIWAQFFLHQTCYFVHMLGFDINQTWPVHSVEHYVWICIQHVNWSWLAYSWDDLCVFYVRHDLHSHSSSIGLLSMDTDPMLVNFHIHLINIHPHIAIKVLSRSHWTLLHPMGLHWHHAPSNSVN